MWLSCKYSTGQITYWLCPASSLPTPPLPTRFLSLSLSLSYPAPFSPAHRFFDKTVNSWDSRNSFVKHAGKYDLLKIDYETKVTKQPSNQPFPYACTLWLPCPPHGVLSTSSNSMCKHMYVYSNPLGFSRQYQHTWTTHFRRAHAQRRQAWTRIPLGYPQRWSENFDNLTRGIDKERGIVWP